MKKEREKWDIDDFWGPIPVYIGVLWIISLAVLFYNFAKGNL